MEITFWGTRGSIASPGADTMTFGGNTTCLELTLASGRTVIIDAGTGIRRLGDALLQRDDTSNLLLLMTHIHWDHLLGFPFFGPIFKEDTRIVVDGCLRAMEGLQHIFSNKYMDGTWPLCFEDLKARIEPQKRVHDAPLDLDSTIVKSHRLQHPQGGLGFRFEESTGSFVFLTDNELRDDGWAGACFKDFVEFVRDADLLAHDCQYLPEELEVRRGWGHSDVDSVARLAIEAGVNRLVLFHHDPWRTDSGVSHIVERCRELLDKAGVSTSVEAAREQVTLKV